MSKVSILIVEDDTDIQRLLAYNLRAAGYEVLTCEEGYEALTVAKQRLPDLILLDLMIPGLDGFEVCKELKRSAETRNIPVIILTARGEEVDRVVGLELGADDYLTKPFEPDELIARVKALFRRLEKPIESKAHVADLEVDFDRMTISRKGKALDISAKEWGIFEYLLRNRGIPKNKGELLEVVWGEQEETLGFDSTTLEVHISSLRKKCGKDLIRTIRNVGYVID